MWKPVGNVMMVDGTIFLCFFDISRSKSTRVVLGVNGRHGRVTGGGVLLMVEALSSPSYHINQLKRS